MATDPELELIGLLELGLKELSAEARIRVLGWGIDWAVCKSEDDAKRVAAYNLVGRVIAVLDKQAQHAVMAALNITFDTSTPVPARQDRPYTPRFVPPRRREKHCSECRKTGHDKRAHAKSSKVAPTDLLELD